MKKFLLILFLLIIVNDKLSAQDSVQAKQSLLPSKYLADISAKASGITEKLNKKSAKAIEQMQKLEDKMKSKLAKKDSLLASSVFSNAKEKYKQLQDKIKNPGKLTQYIPHLDSVATSLNFLQQNPQLLSQAKEMKEKLKGAMSKVDDLKSQLQKAEDIKKFLKERKAYLHEQLDKLGFAKQFKQLNKQAYYYAQQVNEYKTMLKDPKKAEQKALELLSKTSLFKDFMQKNSQLASLFRLPGNSNDPLMQVSMAGLQTRAQVNGLIQQQIASGGPNAQQQFSQNIQAAQSQLSELKNKLLKSGAGSSDAEMPEGFKPNNQKTKSFLKRLEYGTNMQTQKATSFFPVTSDLGLSVGYKPNDKSVIGIGASYKIGFGQNWNNIRISSQGVGLRSYVDYKLKGSFWISGGYEQNYKTAFDQFDQLKDQNAWQQSGLLGLSKVISLKTKMFKKTSLKLLWDFLSYQQIPRTQPVVFRIGYSF